MDEANVISATFFSSGSKSLEFSLKKTRFKWGNNRRLGTKASGNKKLNVKKYPNIKIIISSKKDSLYVYNKTKYYPIKKMELFTIYRK